MMIMMMIGNVVVVMIIIMIMIGNSTDHLLNNFISHESDGVWYNNLEA
jgi:hypothetical protein